MLLDHYAKIQFCRGLSANRAIPEPLTFATPTLGSPDLPRLTKSRAVTCRQAAWRIAVVGFSSGRQRIFSFVEDAARERAHPADPRVTWTQITEKSAHAGQGNVMGSGVTTDAGVVRRSVHAACCD